MRITREIRAELKGAKGTLENAKHCYGAGCRGRACHCGKATIERFIDSFLNAPSSSQFRPA